MYDDFSCFGFCRKITIITFDWYNLAGKQKPKVWIKLLSMKLALQLLNNWNMLYILWSMHNTMQHNIKLLLYHVIKLYALNKI